MKSAASLFLLALFLSASMRANPGNRTTARVLQDAQESVPVVIDWMMEKVREYPTIPGMITAAFLAKIKENFVGKRSSFLVWATLGTVVFTESYRLFSTEYLVQRDLQKKNGLVSELIKVKEASQVALESLQSAAQKGSQELKDKASESINQLTDNK